MSSKSSARIKQKRRPGDPWVSNNRVLNSQSLSKKSIAYGRNPNFDTDETKLLIQLWGDPKVQRTLITTHKKHAVICQLASKMEDYGYYRSPEEITTRIKNLKCFYNRLKKDMESGQATEPSWKHFAEMDAIMTRPIFSVRPNEVPAPSLKYQIEKEREERAAHKRKGDGEGGEGEDGITESESDDYTELLGGICVAQSDPNDDGIIPDVEVDIDINNKALVALAAAAAEQTQTPPPLHTESKTTQASKKRKLSKGSDENSLMSDYEGEPEQGTNSLEDDDADDLVIKEEKIDTIDVEAEDELKQQNAKNNGNPADQDNNNSNANEENANAKNGQDGQTVIHDSSAAFVIPKDEPIDVDDDSMDVQAITATLTSNVQSMMPTLADILQMSKTNLAISSAGNFIPLSSLGTQTINVNAASLCTTSTTNATNATIVTSAQPGKISLVPTNFLMQPKGGNVGTVNALTQSSIILPSSAGQLQPPRLVLSGDASAALQCAANTGIVATGPNGMKVLLVNAEQAAAAGIRGGIPVQTLNTSGTTNLMQPQTQQQHQPKQIAPKPHKNLKQQLLQQQQRERDDRHRIALQKQQAQRKVREERERFRREEMNNKKDVTSMRILMRQLLNAQTENNEIEQQRLALERERFEFEKTSIERFFNVLPTYFAQQQQQLQLIIQQQQQQQNLLQQQQQKQQQQQNNQQQHFITHSPGGQLRLSNPPKLLFTTMPASMSAKSTTILGSTNTLTTSLPKANTIPTSKPVEICTQINDVQLITPKVESTGE